MKIGTKANAIDDLGKFDGSKMTIKVNGKQIYPQKRYSIVRVDNRCPDFFCKYKVMKDEKSFSCNDCNLHRKYGDTKEQMIKKVAQVLIKDEMKYCKWKTKVQKEVCWQNNMELAKEIVEFLGVEE